MALDLKTASVTENTAILRNVPYVSEVLTPAALALLSDLQEKFGLRLHALMLARQRRQDRFDNGMLPTYREDSTNIRKGIWEVEPIPSALNDRRIEIVGGCTPKTLQSARNSGAKVVIADFEDTISPDFVNLIAGQNELNQMSDGPTMMVRPRGLHMVEANVLIKGSSVSAALFDFAVHFANNGERLAAEGQGPYYYLSKIDNAEEARFWNEIFIYAQQQLGLAEGTIKATVMIETLQAAFEMDEIVWELRKHITGLNCGHDDFVFSYLTTLRAHKEYILPNADQVTPDSGFLASFAARLVKVCHRRGIHAIGGMNNTTPKAGIEKLNSDMMRIIGDGHDGAWIAHPDQVTPALAIFEREMKGENQIRQPRQQYRIEPEMLLRPHQGAVTEVGVQANLSLAIEYMAQWLQGNGNVTIGENVVDVSAAEIARCQLRQWIQHSTAIDGTAGEMRLTEDRLGQMIQNEIVTILDRLGPDAFHRGHYASATRIVQESILNDTDYLTTPAYAVLNALA